MPCHTTFVFETAKEFWNCCCDDESPSGRNVRHVLEAEQVMMAHREVKHLPGLAPRGRSRLGRWGYEPRRHEVDELEAAALRRSRRDEWLERLDARLRGVAARLDHGHPPPISFDYVDVPRSG